MYNLKMNMYIDCTKRGERRKVNSLRVMAHAYIISICETRLRPFPPDATLIMIEYLCQPSMS